MSEVSKLAPLTLAHTPTTEAPSTKPYIHQKKGGPSTSMSPKPPEALSHPEAGPSPEAYPPSTEAQRQATAIPCLLHLRWRQATLASPNAQEGSGEGVLTGSSPRGRLPRTGDQAPIQGPFETTGGPGILTP